MHSKSPVRFMDRSTPPHMFTLVVLTAVGALSMTLFLPSLPGMTAYFETEYRLIQLSVAVYLFANGLLQVFVGPISDRYGRRPVVLAGVLIFIVATAGCIFSPTVEIFLGFRLVQAVVVTGIVLSRAIIRDMVPGSEAASMIGYVTMGMAVAPMIGPAIGGLLEQLYGWQASFLLLLLLGVGLFVLCFFDLGETAVNRMGSFREQFSEYPELFRSRRFWGYCLAAGLASGAFFAYLGGAPMVGSDVFGLLPAELGAYFGIAAFGYFVGNFLSARYSNRFGTHRMMLFGSVTATSGMVLSLLCLLAGASHPIAFFGFCAFIGIGNGMTIPNATAGMLSVRPHLAGSASGIGGAILIGGGSGLSALSGATLNPALGAYPLLSVMLATSALSILATAYVIHISRQVSSF